MDPDRKQLFQVGELVTINPLWVFYAVANSKKTSNLKIKEAEFRSWTWRGLEKIGWIYYYGEYWVPEEALVRKQVDWKERIQNAKI